MGHATQRYKNKETQRSLHAKRDTMKCAASYHCSASAHHRWDTPLVRKFASMENPGMLGRASEIVVGSTLGGTSTINGGLYSRPSQDEFDNFWPEGWKSDNVLPFFKLAENYQAETDVPENHGFDGPIKVTRGSKQAYTDEWLAAAEKAGIPITVDGASGSNGKHGVYQMAFTFNRYPSPF